MYLHVLLLVEGLWCLLGSQRVMTLVQFSPLGFRAADSSSHASWFLSLCQIHTQR